ncbi:serine hydrolase [Calidifontibacter terrae]
MIRGAVQVVDGSGEELWREGDVDEVGPTASVGKLLLLAATAEKLDSAEIDGAQPLAKNSVAPVADSGIWFHLDQPTLSVLDCCRLISAVSDNHATNVLLNRIGLSEVDHYTDRLGVAPMRLLDQVRDHRGPGMPQTLSLASPRSLVGFLRLLDDGTVSPRVRDWMRFNTDLSMVASAFGLDPLAHIDEKPLLHNKTGSDSGVRVDVGTLAGDRRTLHYAAVARWSPDDPDARPALAWMRGIGERIRDLV